jgi:hypothetical protein
MIMAYGEEKELTGEKDGGDIEIGKKRIKRVSSTGKATKHKGKKHGKKKHGGKKASKK